MPRRFSTRRRTSGMPSFSTLKRSATLGTSTGTTAVVTNIAKAVDNPVTTVRDDVPNGCYIKAVWLSLDFCGLAATGVQQITGVILFKNAGANLVAPSPFSVGTSNEKRFVLKEWSAMTMRNQDGNPPYHWEGWCKIPRKHQRMATDDILQLVSITDSAAGHFSIKYIYKYRF